MEGDEIDIRSLGHGEASGDIGGDVHGEDDEEAEKDRETTTKPVKVERQDTYRKMESVRSSMMLIEEEGVDGFRFTSSNPFKMRWEGSNTMNLPKYRDPADVFNTLQMKYCMSEVISEEGRISMNNIKTKREKRNEGKD